MSRFKSPGCPAPERISESARCLIIGEIEKAGGNEVFFIGSRDGEGLIDQVTVWARGNDAAVPAVGEAARAGDVLLHNHPSGILVPSGDDLEVASRFGSMGVGFYILDNECLRIYAVVEPRLVEPPPEDLDPEIISGIFGPEGSLASAHPNFEERPEQARMACDVAHILDRGALGILEAGTGTGKSLAYLVPAALWADGGNRRVVIATRTINLQEQILSNDLPILEEALGRPVKMALVKGRGNYCCLRKRDMLAGEEGGILLDFEDMREVQALLEWSRNTPDGSLSDLPFVPVEANWSLFRAESDSCLRARCPHFSSCFFYSARTRSASADLLLANHHLLFADLALRAEGGDSAAIMPPYQAVILDEGHNVEDIALSYFDAGISRYGFMGYLGRLVSRRRSGRGLLPFLHRKVGTLKGIGAGDRERLSGLARDLEEEVGLTRERLDVLFDELGGGFVSWLGGRKFDPEPDPPAGEGVAAPANGQEAARDREDYGEKGRWRIPPLRREEPPWSGISRSLGEMASLTGSLQIRLRKVCGRVKDLVEAGHDDLNDIWADLSSVLFRLEATGVFLARVLEGEEAQEVFWVEVRSRRGRWEVSLHLTPLDAAPILKETLFSKVPSLVFTSATLTVMEKFDFFDDRLGIPEITDREVIHRLYPTPFDLRSQMRLAVIDNIPDPGAPGFVDGLVRAVGDLVLAAGGGALVLFTSYRTLRSVHERCHGLFLGAGIRTFCQGEAPRTTLLDHFRADPDSVLFATDSFWEGVDVAGSALRLVVMARLPFPVPTDPVNEARCQVLLEEGRDPFLEDSVPRAVIRMRQGLGRLIRHREDRGVAAICDGRMIRRAYGRVFLRSLGGISATGTGLEDAVREVEWFLKRSSGE